MIFRGWKNTMDIKNDPRFKGIEPFKSKLWLSSPTMHRDEQRWVDEAILTNWVSTVGENINVVERQVAEKVGRKYAVALEKAFELYPEVKLIVVAHKTTSFVFQDQLFRESLCTRRQSEPPRNLNRQGQYNMNQTYVQ